MEMNIGTRLLGIAFLKVVDLTGNSAPLLKDASVVIARLRTTLFIMKPISLS